MRNKDLVVETLSLCFVYFIEIGIEMNVDVLVSCKLLSSLESGGQEDLLASLATDVLGLALLHGLHLGAVLDGLGVGQLSGADQKVEVLGLE